MKRSGRLAMGDGAKAQGIEAPLGVCVADMYEALVAIVEEARAVGYYEQAPYHPEAGCGCGQCLALRALVRAEGGGRCILCGRTEEDMREGETGWVNGDETCCDAHGARERRGVRAWQREEARFLKAFRAVGCA